MRTFNVLPVDTLKPFIDRFWGWESTLDEVVSLPTLLPGTGAELYFHYRRPFRRMTNQGEKIVCDTAHLLCVRREPITLCPAYAVGFVAVRFRVGMLHRFTNIPGCDLIDRVLPIDDLWGVAGKELALKVAESESPFERLRLIQGFLTRQLRIQPVDELVERAISSIYSESSSISIKELAIRMEISCRQMERRFRQLTGQSPAEIRRLGRFQKVVRSLLLEPSAIPLDVALTHGYYDQSHFNRDFRELVFESPGRFLKMVQAKTHFYNTPRKVFEKMAAPIQ